MPTVYDLNGDPHEKDPVDCRECCQEMGWSMTPPEVTGDGGGDEFGGMTVAQLKDYLNGYEVDYPANAKKADLLALCRAR